MTMEQGIKEVWVNVPFDNNLDPYHQLVEIQKQMIMLAQQNERVRQECEELHEQVADAAINRAGARPHLRPTATPKSNAFSRMSAARASLFSRIIKDPTRC